MPMVKDYLKNAFKHGIEAGKFQYGVAQETTSPDVAEVLATSEYDWLFIDGEHGPHTMQTVLEIARAIAPYDMTPVVRIPEAGTGEALCRFGRELPGAWCGYGFFGTGGR